ncbi:hypothetical protein Ocin01_13573 [Orchesella cincta]|uniref:Uncharacterized protein n=1 Tax=Orchesella cincta TaxID=48709 RepID=A0A1D2MJD3_ORCCI|nr:hypothetical protein Ocin01_13573 [Orchesella cincta]
MSRILQSQSIIGQIISRSFSRSGFCSTKYSLSVAPGHFCECCGINGTRHVSVVNKFKYGFSTPSISVQSSKFHTSLSTYSEESQDEEKRGEVEKSPRNEERRESVIDRLRRLSETPADDYELSPVAQEKARQMAEIRAESIRKGEHWKLDQRNMRPGGFPQQNQRYNNNRNGGFRDEEDFYGGGGGGRQPGYNRDRGFNRYDRNDESYGGGGRQQGGYNRNRSFDRYNRDDEEFDTDDLRDEPVDRSSWRGRSLSPKQSQYGQRQSREEQFDDNEPQDYEQEMERLRARLQKTKEEKARLQSSKKEAAPSEDIDSQERSSGASKS